MDIITVGDKQINWNAESKSFESIVKTADNKCRSTTIKSYFSIWQLCDAEFEYSEARDAVKMAYKMTKDFDDFMTAMDEANEETMDRIEEHYLTISYGGHSINVCMSPCYAEQFDDLLKIIGNFALDFEGAY